MDGNLRTIFRERIPGWHWQAIETGTGRGVPDANYCAQGVEGWIEFKQTHGWQCPLRPEQVGWHLRRARAGGLTFVATRRIAKAHSGLWLHRGADAALLRASGLRPGENAPTALYQGQGSPGSWDWEKIKKVLLGA